MKPASIMAHIRDIIILPGTVTVLVPWHFIHPAFVEGNFALKVIGTSTCLIGFAFFLYTVFLFRTIGKGTLAPWSPKQKLVVSGPYQYCRNPMITGVLLILAGETLFFESYGLLIWVLTFVAVNTIYFFIYEEPDLESRFGDAYRLYKKHVPRWIPRLTPFNPGSEL